MVQLASMGISNSPVLSTVLVTWQSGTLMILSSEVDGLIVRGTTR